MSAPQIAAWLAGLGIRVGAKYVRSRGSRLARHLYKNKKGLLGGAVAAGGANIVTSSKRLPNSEGVKRYYRVTKNPPLKPRHPRKALNPKRITSASFDTVDPVAAKKKRPTLSVGSYGGRFKKRRRSKRVTRPTQGNKDTVYGVMSGSGAVYHGWSTCGGRDYAIKQFSEQLLKQVCYERKVDIRGRDQALEWNTGGANRIDKLQLLHRLVAGDGTVYEGLEDVTLVTTLGGHTSASFDTVVINLETKLKLILDTEGRYIYGYKLHETNSAAASAPPPVVRLQLDTWKFNMNVKVSYKVQNITPADDVTGTKDDDMGYSKDSILANPLRGRTYEFSPGYPRVRPAVLTQASALQIVSKETAPHGFVTFPTGGNAIYGAGMPMHAPPPGGTLFQNCIKGSAVNIQPGNFKIMYSNFKFSGSVKQFCSKVTSATNSVTGKLSRFTLGNTVAYGLMPTMRTHGETIKIAYQYDCTSTSTLRPKYKCTIPRNNASTHLDFIATMSAVNEPSPTTPQVMSQEEEPPASAPTIVQTLPNVGGSNTWATYNYYQTVGNKYVYVAHNATGPILVGVMDIAYDYITGVWEDYVVATATSNNDPATVVDNSGTIELYDGTPTLVYSFTDPYLTTA